ncbi:MAG TPA: PAS domain-containing protein, partial [Pseudolabrys sp.]|nr:PAS domain-containing protein [Pseudolabrys sp.]
MASHDSTALRQARVARQAFDKSQTAPRGGSIGLVLAIAIVLTIAAGGLIYVSRDYVEVYLLILLAALGTIGVFALFATAAGIMKFAGRDQDNPLLKAVVDSAFDGVLVTDQAGRVFYANSTYLDLIGASGVNDVRPIERVFMGDPDVSESIYRLLKAAREGRRLQEEVRIPSAAGETGRWLRMRVRPLGDTRRNARMTVWSIGDVTRERERQENVFQELQHAIDYLDHAPAGFFSVDAAGDIVYLNATLAAWLDQDLAQVGAGPLKLGDIIAGEGAALLTMLNAAPGEVKTEVFDLDLRTRGGKPVPVRLFHKVAFGADGSPGPSRTLALNRARGEGNDPQRAAEVRFMRFFQNTPMAIATVDKTSRIGRSNARFATTFEGLLRSEDRSILSVVIERDRPALEAAIRKAAEGQSDIAPVEAALTGSPERWANFFVLAVDEEDRDVEAAIVYALETTAQRTLENRFQQQQKMESVGQLAGGIAHDFNNVLSAIMMATDFLLNAHKPTDPSFKDIMQIKQNANRAAALVRQLLAFSRKQTLRPQVLDLGETLSDLGMLLKRLIGEKVSLEIVHGRDLWPVKVDISQFEQVIVNLAVNARDAMPDGGKLTLRTANVSAPECDSFAFKGMPKADYVLVEVSDTGMGIPGEIIDKIFEPFFTTKEVGKGTGLGLSTVYGIVKQTGGFVYADSEPSRTAFRIFLPRHVPGADAVLALPAGDAPAIAGALAAADTMARAAT